LKEKENRYKRKGCIDKEYVVGRSWKVTCRKRVVEERIDWKLKGERV
jgi:hypothetical protein